MASWEEVVAAAPELAEAARARFDAHRHKTLATLRRDGSPRISGVETSFADGELWLGMMSGSLKALDLRRDPRLALHSASVDPPEEESTWAGDAKLAGRAVEITDEATVAAVTEGAPGPSHVFRVDVSELVLTRVGDPADHLVIQSWSESNGLRRMERR
jgi:Pyridoxamine 5'-phosphate oxidase